MNESICIGSTEQCVKTYCVGLYVFSRTVFVIHFRDLRVCDMAMCAFPGNGKYEVQFYSLNEV